MTEKNGYSIIACGGVANATGANFLVKTPKTTFLVDCGLIQGSHFAVEENRQDFPYDPTEAEYLFITHAHMDHVGRIPKLVKDGFKGVIYSTPETKELAALMLEDAVNLLDREARETKQPAIYGREDIGHAMGLWKTVPYHIDFAVTPEISVYLKDAGHVLGSTIYEFTFKDARDGAGMKVAFTGDLGNSPTPLLRDTEYVTDADYMLMESVYGDRNHEPKDERDARLKEILNTTLARGGTVVIPAFSLERTQVILFEIHELFAANALPHVPIFLDSPLALKITSVYERFGKDFNQARQDEIAKTGDLFDFPGLKVVHSPQESAAIHSMKGAKIIIAGSGMSVGGRVLSHEAYYLEDPNATILLVGYQVAGSLGRQIEDGVKKLTIAGEAVNVRAHTDKISGYSSHKDSDHLVEFVSHAQPAIKQVFIAMGETKSSAFLAQRIRDELGVNAIVAEKVREYPLV